jgi:hypothetical protein
MIFITIKSHQIIADQAKNNNNNNKKNALKRFMKSLLIEREKKISRN